MAVALFAPVTLIANTTPPLFLDHVTVVDVLGGSLQPDRTVIIRDRRIESITPAGVTHAPRGSRIVRGTGKYLIPGLWDMHVHVGGDDHALRLLLASGITGVRDMGGDVRQLAEVRRRIVAGQLLGPRMVYAGPVLAGPEASADVDRWIVRTPQDGRRAVDSLVAMGVDFIKVHEGIPRDAFFALADAARERKIPFVGHVPASLAPAGVSDLGQRSIEHLEFIPDSCHALFDLKSSIEQIRAPAGCDSQALLALFDRFAHNGTWLCPTIGAFRYFAPKQWNAIFRGFRSLVPGIRRSGIGILAGTDLSGFLESKGAKPASDLHEELALLVDSGFTPAEVLRAATANPARFLGLTAEVGTVEAGKSADLVLLDADPLGDIHNVQRVAAVVRQGRYLPRPVARGGAEPGSNRRTSR